MQTFYNSSIYIYKTLVSIVSLWNKKAKLFKNGRQNWRQNLKEKRNLNQPLIWFHCSSLGEFEQAKPVIESTKKQYPNHQIAVSFFSPSGYEVQKNTPLADFTFYLPLDTPRNAKDLVKILNPELLILVKYEYWFNLIKALKSQNRPIIVISAILHPHQIFFKNRVGKWFRKGLKNLSYFFVQNQETKDLLNKMGIEQVQISGDTRFDRVKQILKEDNHIDYIEQFKSDKKLLIVGSSWQKDEQMILNYFHQNEPENVKIIFAPHNLKNAGIQQLMSEIKLPKVQYTKIDDSTNLQQAKVLVLDTMGMLTKVYQYADFAYVGGGFTKSGVHNTLEPAIFGVPVVIGENFSKFQEAKDLVKLGGIQSYKTQEELNSIFDTLFNNEEETNRRGKIAYDYIQNQPNATQMIMEYLNQTIKKT